jgi:hypothetical protein
MLVLDANANNQISLGLVLGFKQLVHLIQNFIGQNAGLTQLVLITQISG